MVPLRLPFTHGADYASLRAAARSALGPERNPELLDDALIVITELVENVVQHTDDGGELSLQLHANALHIEVTDASEVLPRQYEPDPRRVGGRGLLLVTAMTSAWGVRRTNDGKTVWADLPLF